MKIIVTVVIMSAMCACSSSQPVESVSTANSEIKNSSNKLVLDEATQLAQAKRNSEDFVKFKKFWNPEVLKNFKEPSLEKPAVKIEESYRFIWIPSFHNPIAIRVWRSGESKFIVVKKTNGQDFEMGKLSYEKTRKMTEEEWLKFTNLLDRISFWKMAEIDMNQVPSTDGAHYSIEGRKDNQFHEVHRNTGNNEQAEVRELGAYLLSLSELKTNYAEY